MDWCRHCEIVDYLCKTTEKLEKKDEKICINTSKRGLTKGDRLLTALSACDTIFDTRYPHKRIVLILRRGGYRAVKDTGMTAPLRGYQLDTNEIKDLKGFAENVLGTGYYAWAREFFLSIFKSSARYKVFLRRRCLNWMYLFYSLEGAEQADGLSAAVTDTMYSDSALLANCAEIAQQYSTLGFIPSILIVDDILIHGRTLNRLIDGLINSVYHVVQREKADVDREILEQDILGSLNIRVMVQNGNPLLLRPQYMKRLFCAEDRSDIWEPHRWHELSARISRLMGEGIFQNTSFILSLYNLEGAAAREYQALASKNGFYIDYWNKRNCRNVGVRALRNADGDILAFYTIRITQNSANGKYCIVPFLFCSEITKPDMLVDAISERLKSCGLDQVERVFQHWKDSVRTMAEMLYLVFSHNVLLLLLGEGEYEWDWSDSLDVEKTVLSFRSRMEPEHAHLISQLACIKEPFFSWTEMGDLLTAATEGAAPLVPAHWISESSIEGYQPQKYVELILSQRAEMRELNAYHQCASQDRTEDVVEFLDINSLYSAVRDLRGDGKLGSDNEIGALMAAILRLMDMGYMSVHAELREREGQRCYVCTFHEGEQSQAIRVRQYADYLPVLIEMERDCSSRLESIKERVSAFYRNLPDGTVEGILGFIEKLYRSGQRLQDWNVSTLQWSEADEADEGQNSNERLIKEMALKTAQRLKELERYQSEFHTGQNIY